MWNRREVQGEENVVHDFYGFFSIILPHGHLAVVLTNTKQTSTLSGPAYGTLDTLNNAESENRGECRR